MKWVFVDYENVNSLDALKLSDYEWVILFCGPKDKKVKIDLASIAVGKVPKIEIVRIEKSAKDNLDFHLAMYLGRYHELVDENVEFVVFSNDTGFDGIIGHMKTLGRKCKKVKQSAKNPQKAAKKPVKKVAKKSVKKTAPEKVAKQVTEKTNEGGERQIKANSQELMEARISALKAFKKSPEKNWPTKESSLLKWLESSLAIDAVLATLLMDSMKRLEYFSADNGKITYSIDLSRVED